MGTTLLWVSPAIPACRAKRLMRENSSTTAPSGGPFSRTPHRRRALRGGWGDWTTPPGKHGRKACFSIAVLRHLWRSLAQSGGRILLPRLLLLLFLTLGLTGGPMGGIIGIIMAPIGTIGTSRKHQTAARKLSPRCTVQLFVVVGGPTKM